MGPLAAHNYKYTTTTVTVTASHVDDTAYSHGDCTAVVEVQQDPTCGQYRQPTHVEVAKLCDQDAWEQYCWLVCYRFLQSLLQELCDYHSSYPHYISRRNRPNQKPSSYG